MSCNVTQVMLQFQALLQTRTALAAMTCNRLPERLCPQVTQGFELLAQHGLRGRMTGSGSAVFAQVPADLAQASEVQAPPDWQVRVQQS